VTSTIHATGGEQINKRTKKEQELKKKPVRVLFKAIYEHLPEKFEKKTD
jgi:hypothetical protein